MPIILREEMELKRKVISVLLIVSMLSATGIIITVNNIPEGAGGGDPPDPIYIKVALHDQSIYLPNWGVVGVFEKILQDYNWTVFFLWVFRSRNAENPLDARKELLPKEHWPKAEGPGDHHSEHRLWAAVKES